MLFRNQKLEVFCATLEYAILIAIKRGCFNCLRECGGNGCKRQDGSCKRRERAVSSGLIAKYFAALSAALIELDAPTPKKVCF